MNVVRSNRARRLNTGVAHLEGSWGCPSDDFGAPLTVFDVITGLHLSGG
jgi:hypothetical protein